MLNRKTKSRKRQPVKRRNTKILAKLAIAFAIVLVALAVYVKAYPYTNEAKQRIELESTSQKLQEVKSQLEQTQVESEAQVLEKQRLLEETNKKLQEAEKALQAKRSAPKVLAESKPVTPPVKSSGSCVDWMRQAGIPDTPATHKLIINESGCRTGARNPSSGACGIPQAYPCSKLKCPLNDSGAVCQLKWMDNYVKNRYGSWESALSAWYSRCGSKQGCWY